MIAYEDLGKLNKPFFEEYISKFKDTLNSGWYILGENVKQFEQEFASYCGSSFCIGLASGLDALILAIKAFEFPPQSEILVPSNTYIATILAIINAGHKPILVEPDLQTYNIDPDKIEEKITSSTRAILVVHLYGKTCSMEKITNICSKHNLKLIEDCAQAHGAKYKDRTAGTFGDFGAFSFYPTKNLGAIGDAGALTTDKEELSILIRSLRNYGSSKKYHNDHMGHNSRLDEVQAGFLSIKLKKLDQINTHKRKLASQYLVGLKDDFIKPVVDPDYFDVYHIFNVRHSKRDELKKYLEENGIKTEVHYPIPPHQQKGYKDVFKNESYPVSELIHKTTLSLPISFFHSEREIEKVIEIMNKF